MQTLIDLPMDNRRHEAFAQARAAGRTSAQAAAEAGYAKPTGSVGRLNRREDIGARIAVLLARRVGGGSRDISGLIDKLVQLAETAAGKEEARALDVARECLSEAARLKERLPPEATPLAATPTEAPPPRELSVEEWIARHDPPARTA